VCQNNVLQTAGESFGRIPNVQLPYAEHSAVLADPNRDLGRLQATDVGPGDGPVVEADAARRERQAVYRGRRPYGTVKSNTAESLFGILKRARCTYAHVGEAWPTSDPPQTQSHLSNPGNGLPQAEA
jgi:hypothetical protein